MASTRLAEVIVLGAGLSMPLLPPKWCEIRWRRGKAFVAVARGRGRS